MTFCQETKDFIFQNERMIGDLKKTLVDLTAAIHVLKSKKMPKLKQAQGDES